MGASEDLCGLVRNGPREMAARKLKAGGPRKDGGLLSGWARRLFRGKSLKEVREIAFEIGMQGKYMHDINDFQQSHVLRALLGEELLGAGAVVHHVCGIREERAGDESERQIAHCHRNRNNDKSIELG
jgi:hypothetical protein